MIRDAVEEGESRYWRAWNLRETGKLVEARADSDRAKQILYNDRILTLAGQIERPGRHLQAFVGGGNRSNSGDT